MTNAGGIPGLGGEWFGGQSTARARCVLAPNPSPMTLDGTNTWLIGEPGSGRVGLIDPGPDDVSHWVRCATAAEELDARIELILLTHGHADHSEGARMFADRAGCEVRALDPAFRLGDEGLAGGDVVEVGGTALRVVATPGHTSDSLSFVLAADAALLTGDTILGRGTTVVAHPDGRLDEYLDSLDRLRDMSAEGNWQVVLPGHGPTLEDPTTVIDLYIAHRKDRLAQVKAALIAISEGNEQLRGDELAQRVVEVVYADVPRAVWPAAFLSVKAQLAYLS